MSLPIEDYALLSDLQTGALISQQGSIDWLCFPRFDSPSIFAALLGSEEHGRWLLAPTDPEAKVTSWQYRKDTFILETEWHTPQGAVKVLDFMPIGGRRASVIRRIEGLTGTVTMEQELELRFDYARAIPWVYRSGSSRSNQALLAVAGPTVVALRGPHLPTASDHRHRGTFQISAGETKDYELLWYPSHRNLPAALNVNQALEETQDYWQQWADSCRKDGVYAPYVKRSLLVLRALSHEDTGGIVAAPTTSLPEEFGGSRNWDYRFCWLRDAALTLEAMLSHGYAQEALTWRNWLLRAVAGDPEDLQIMYGLAGERQLPEEELDHFPGYENSRPVRVGNGAVGQYQADVVGEVMFALDRLRAVGGHEDKFSWPLQRSLLKFAENHVSERDHGVWEMRGERQYFTHSRVMMWAAFDCGVRAVEQYGLRGPVKKWQRIREQLRAEIMESGFNQELNSFTQVYGGEAVDASLLVLPHVGFIDYEDPKMLGTVARIESELSTKDGLLLRYRTESGLDGLEPGEHPFLACSFWLVEQYARSGRREEAVKLMDTLVGFCNPLGLLSEEYDAEAGRMVGNYPQAFSHLALVRAADALSYRA